MAKEQFLKTEAARERTASILHAREAVRRNIWSTVSAKGLLAYRRLDAAVYAGVVIDDGFINQEGETIVTAFPVLGAHLQQTLVDHAIKAMLKLNRTAPEEKHDVILFPPVEQDDNVTQERSVVDVLKVIPGQFERCVSAAAEIARVQVANTVVTHDSIKEKLRVDTPLLYLPFIVEDFTIMTVPTVIPSTYLRYSKREGSSDTIAEFVMEAL